MAQEFSDGIVSVMDEEPLRPPESWPGAGGLKSVAPDVPSWPTGPISGLAPPPGTVTEAPRPKGTGEGWPGAGGPVAQPASPTPQPAQPAPSRVERRDSAQRRAMGASLLLLLACVAIAAWVALDANSRVLQATLLALVFIVGGVFVTRTLKRPR